MNEIEKILINSSYRGEYWITYQQVGKEKIIYINCEPKKLSGSSYIRQVRVSTNLILSSFINIELDELHYACRCKIRCECGRYPPKFRGNYKIYDRDGVLSILPLDVYYSLSPLAIFDHRNLIQLNELRKMYNVMYWVSWNCSSLYIIENDYYNGIPIYDMDSLQRVIIACMEVMTIIKIIVESVEFSQNTLSLISIIKNMNLNINKFQVLINI